MAQITLGGNPVNTIGILPEKGNKAPNFTLTQKDLTEVSIDDFKGKKLILNIFPSVDTRVCAQSVRKFNAEVSKLANTAVLCISNDLPMAQVRFCGAEGLENVITLSGFRNKDLGNNYGTEMTDGPMKGLHARAVVVIDEEGIIKHQELVSEIGQEPNYEAALSAL